MGIIQTTKELRPRDKADHYPTPIELCRAAVKEIPFTGIPVRTILDPGAGAGVWGKAAKERWPFSNILGIEMDTKWEKPEEYAFWEQCDYLKWHWNMPAGFDLVIGNPPYGVNADGTKDRKLAEKFVRHAWANVREGGHIVFLLRLGFLEGQNRIKTFWPTHPLKDIYVLSRRPSFTGNQKTDATSYGLFIWQKGYIGPTYMKWLVWDYDNPEETEDV